MADETVTQPAPEVTQGNAPEIRTETGEIKDQQAKLPEGTAGKEPTKEATKDEAKPADKAVVPDKYEFKVPEGQQLNEALVAEATPLFKELGLSQEGAQKLFDFHNKAMADLQAAPAKAYEEMRDGWRKDVTSDKDLGDGKGGLNPKVSADIAKTIDALPNAKEFREAMNLTGVGDNPAFVRAFAHLAKQLSEGTPVRGSGPSPAGQMKSGEVSRPTPAQAMYPSLPSSAS